MLKPGPAKKVTIFLNEDTQHGMKALHDAVMLFLMEESVSGATATRAYSGFGSHHLLHTPKIEILAQHLPLRIEFIESPKKVEALLPRLCELVTDGLIEVQDTNVIQMVSSKSRPSAEAAAAEPTID
jgi:PII-like signaling protein